MGADGLLRGSEGGSITSVEAFVLGVMAAILVAIGMPSYLAMRDRSHDSTARAHARRAADAVEEFRAVNGTLTGATPVALRRIDAGLEPASYRLEISGAKAFCVESSVGGREWHIAGPGGTVARGGCP